MKRKRDEGFSLAALIFFLTAASILIAAAVPAYQVQARRDREEELIFRGEEYTRAIQKYQRKFGIYPLSIDALVETNGLRFVRRAYKDPITGKDFRLISINPDGSVSGSIVAGGGNNVPLFGDVQRFGSGSGQEQQSGLFPQQQQPQATSQTAPQGTLSGFSQQQQQQQQQPPGFSPPQGANRAGGGASSPNQFSPQPQQGPKGSQQQATMPAGFSAGLVGSGNGQLQNAAGTPVVGGAGIIGVASDSKESSLKVYNKREKYNEWEFIAILGRPGQPPNAPPFGGAPPGTNPAQSGLGGSGNIAAPTNPVQQQPFGFGNPQYGQQPFGSGNPQSGQQPSGFGNPQSGQQPSGFGNPQGGQQPNAPIKRP